MYRVVAIMGKSASGKDTLLNAICEKFPKLNKKISTTTRPKRDYEVDGVDYFFTDPTQFAQKIIDGDMMEATSFNDWFYGTEKKAFVEDEINIGIFNPDGIRALLEDGRIDLTVVYLTCPDKLRLIRSLNREENPDIEEIFRRFKTDSCDFDGIDFDFIELESNSTSTIEALVKQLTKIILGSF